jgi:hypothetical protein
LLSLRNKDENMPPTTQQKAAMLTVTNYGLPGSVFEAILVTDMLSLRRVIELMARHNRDDVSVVRGLIGNHGYTELEVDAAIKLHQLQLNHDVGQSQRASDFFIIGREETRKEDGPNAARLMAAAMAANTPDNHPSKSAKSVQKHKPQPKSLPCTNMVPKVPQQAKKTSARSPARPNDVTKPNTRSRSVKVGMKRETDLPAEEVAPKIILKLPGRVAMGRPVELIKAESPKVTMYVSVEPKVGAPAGLPQVPLLSAPAFMAELEGDWQPLTRNNKMEYNDQTGAVRLTGTTEILDHLHVHEIDSAEYAEIAADEPDARPRKVNLLSPNQQMGCC